MPDATTDKLKGDPSFTVNPTGWVPIVGATAGAVMFTAANGVVTPLEITAGDHD